MSHEIFISYRRKDTGGYAGRLYENLLRKFGRNGVLFDVEVDGSAELLRDWVSRVMPHVAVELVLIGEEWVIDRHGRRRLDEADDVVRLEIELGLRHAIPIIPVMIDDASFPKPVDLPESIKELGRFKGYEINNSYWEAKIEPLVEAIFSVTKTHVPVLKSGVLAWNAWRQRNRGLPPNLAFGNFAGENLESADLSDANLESADLSGTNLRATNLRSANLNLARLADANLERADLSGSKMRGANLARAVLKAADLQNADLSHANLNEADLTAARITKCFVYGVSAWDARLEDALQSDLLVTADTDDENSVLTVDNIQMAVVLNLLSKSDGVKELIEVVTSKMVLVLGRFTPDRKVVLDAIRETLRKQDYLPVLLDFEKPSGRSSEETVSTLANMSRFIIADLTDPSSVPHELAMIVPGTIVPVQPILLEGQQEYTMFVDLKKRYHWVLEPYRYKSKELLIAQLNERVIAPAENKAKELASKK